MTRRVLVVDDEPDLLAQLARILSASDIEVELAASGTEGLARAAVSAPDLVVLDIRLGDMDGLDVLRELKSRRPGLPVVMLTAYGHVESARAALMLGAAEYLTKPFDVGELRAVVRRALGPGAP